MNYNQMIDLCRTTNLEQRSEKLCVLPMTATTMDDVDAAIEAGRPDGFTVIALAQKAGVGSVDPLTGKARKWWSGEGNLMLSRIVEVPEGVHPRVVNMIAALAVGQCIGRILGEASRVSWKAPNDVLVDQAKISGVLVRKSATPLKMNMGVGVNIAAVPPQKALREKAAISSATALWALGERAWRVGIGDFFAAFEARWEALWGDFLRTRAFSPVLQALGFLSSDGTLVAATAGREVTGVFSGFFSDAVGREFMALRAGGQAFSLPVRDMILRGQGEKTPFALP